MAGDLARRTTQAAAALLLPLLILPAASSGQLIDRQTADSLSVQQILEIAARDSVLQRRSDAMVLAAELIRTDTVGGARTDSLVRGLRDLTFSGIDASMHVTALNALLASGTAHDQHGMLLVVFDSARNADTRAAMLQKSHLFPDSLRRDLLLRGVQLAGSQSATYVANLAAMMAIQWVPDGPALLREAQTRGSINDTRTARMVTALLENFARPRQR